jgi:hypothetical protein
LAAQTLPDDAYNKLERSGAIQKASTVFGHGAKIGVRLSLTGPQAGGAEFKKELEANLTNRLKNMGMSVVASSTAQVSVSVTETDTGETVEVRPFFPRPGENPLKSEKVPIKKLTCLVAVSEGATVLWKTEMVFQTQAFGTIELKENETTAMTLSRELWAGVGNFAPNVMFPTLIGRSGGNVLILPGQSVLTGDK